MSAQPPAPPRPGDIILTRAIAWWDSGQIQRAIVGILASAAPFFVDIIKGNDPFTFRSAMAALTLGLFAWIGYKRAASPDIVTGIKALDKANVAAAAVPPAGPKPGA